jgi:aminopeptidase N
MKLLLWPLLLLAMSAVQAATPHLDLELTLDPATRHFQAKADLTTTGPLNLPLDPLFHVSRVITQKAKSGAPRRVTMTYSGTLPALPQGGPGRSADPGSLFAAPEGSFLAAGSGWYPDPGVAFTYRVTISLPAGQKAVAPGRQTRYQESGSGFVAEYEFDQPAEGISVMAGPYQVSEQSLRLDDGKPVKVRTWFHADLSSLADGYLQDSAGYIQRYSRSIGDYPFGEFSIVASPLSHGLGMPGVTYLGRDVLRLPFIRGTSLGHEVLHNWWGNGVYPDWSTGNWSEGLTTFMADYAFREDRSAEAAREMRLDWLRDLAAVAPSDETSLADFRSRHHGISSVIGYGKSAMVFLMLRDEIGQPAFDRGLRLFWQRHLFRSARWKDLELAFAATSGRDLSGFFGEWVRRSTSPSLALAAPPAGSEKRRFKLAQQGDLFELSVPLRIRLASGEMRDTRVRVRDRETVIDPAAAGVPAGAWEVALDPELRLWRRLDAKALPPIFREVFISPRSEVLVAGSRPEWTELAMALAGRLLESQLHPVSEAQLLSSPDVPALVVGDRGSVSGLIARLGLGALPDVLMQEGAPLSTGIAAPLKGSAQTWTVRAPNGKTLLFVVADDPASLRALQRAMPHYGRQSWLVFDGGRVAGQGAWPAPAQSLSLE